MSRSFAHRHICSLVLGASLFACAEPPDEQSYIDNVDPMVEQALADNLMSDPDLVGQNEANAALVGSTDASLPMEVVTAEAVRESRDKALEILAKNGGLQPLPEPVALSATGQDSPLELLADQARRLGISDECISSASLSTIWAARLPDYLPIYPRGATMEAIGSRKQGCTFGAVRFLTGAMPEDVAAFYASLAKAKGFAISYSEGDGHHRVTAEREGGKFSIHVRPSLEGLTEVDLSTVES